MNDHAFYDGGVKVNLDDPNDYSPDGIPGSGDEVSFALSDHYFSPLFSTLDINSIGDACPGRVENSATPSANDAATGITIELDSGTDSVQGSQDDNASVNGLTLSFQDAEGAAVHDVSTIGVGGIETAGSQEGTIDTASIYAANEDDGNLGDPTSFADGTDSESAAVIDSTNGDAADAAPTSLIYVGNDAGEAAGATVCSADVDWRRVPP